MNLKDVIADEKQNWKSQLTGKTWYDMNEQERTAHQLARGVPVTTNDQDVLRSGQKYLVSALRGGAESPSSIRKDNAARMRKQYGGRING